MIDENALGELRALPRSRPFRLLTDIRERLRQQDPIAQGRILAEFATAPLDHRGNVAPGGQPSAIGDPESMA